MISRALGGTVGHHVTNMRVVDDACGGNVSFLKACARFAIKSLIGIYSFIAMATTRRNQTVPRGASGEAPFGRGFRDLIRLARGRYGRPTRA